MNATKDHWLREQHAAAVAASRQLVCEALALVEGSRQLAEDTAAACRRSAEAVARLGVVRAGIGRP